MTRSLQVPATLLSALLVFAFASPQLAHAQEPEVPPQPAVQEEGSSRFGVGFQSAWPAWGISGMYDVNDRVTAQAVVGLLGALRSYSVRGMYTFSSQESYEMYGFGTVGMWSYPFMRENVVGVGGGAGAELNWRRILSPEDGSFPPLFSTIDLGLVLANFEYYNFSGLSVGVGLHYRF